MRAAGTAAAACRLCSGPVAFHTPGLPPVQGVIGKGCWGVVIAVVRFKPGVLIAGVKELLKQARRTVLHFLFGRWAVL